MIDMAVTVDKYGFCPRHGIKVSPAAACVDCLNGRPPVVPARRLNVGCGTWPLLYWTNLDESTDAFVDIRLRVPPLPFDDGALDEIYAGHFLEHLSPSAARAFLAEALRCLSPGGKLGIVVPDTREILTRWLRGDRDAVEYPPDHWHDVADLDSICGLFLYSTAQESRHQWSYDLGTLRRLLEASGFTVGPEIDRYRDPRLGTGQWYQCGWDAFKPEASS